MSPYASGTTVPVGKTVGDLQALVGKHGGTSWMHVVHDGRAIVGWMMKDRVIRFTVVLPHPGSQRVKYTDSGVYRQPSARKSALAAEERRVWRALFMVIKAKLIAVDEQVVEFEREFFANIVVPGGGTVYDAVAPRLQLALDGTAVDLFPSALTAGGES